MYKGTQSSQLVRIYKGVSTAKNCKCCHYIYNHICNYLYIFYKKHDISTIANPHNTVSRFITGNDDEPGTTLSYPTHHLNRLNYFTYRFQWAKMLRKFEKYTFNANTPGATVFLQQHDFVSGTVRITQPGHYVLQEDIVFDPNPHTDFSSPQNTTRYPGIIGGCGAYILGFFAAITIETDGVVLDLNKKTIRQSKRHWVRQRFFSLIEMASAPFVPPQGPASFDCGTNSFRSASNTVIMNGYLGLSSHHAIHGNFMQPAPTDASSNIMLFNLTIQDFEIAAVHLNGAVGVSMVNLTIHKSLGFQKDVTLAATLSQSVFLLQNTRKSVAENNDVTLFDKTGQELWNNLYNLVKQAENAVLGVGTIPDIFQTLDGRSDGHMYGIVVASRGVIVNEKELTRSNEGGNEDIYFENVAIQDIDSIPTEICGLQAAGETQHVAYGSKTLSGPHGDIVDMCEMANGDLQTHYHTSQHSALINLQAWHSKHQRVVTLGNNETPSAKSDFFHSVITWIENPNANHLADFINEQTYQLTRGQDSMGHIMKGTIGLFLSNVKTFQANGLLIDGISNAAAHPSVITSWINDQVVSTDPVSLDLLDTIGVLVCGSEGSVQFVNTLIQNINSIDGGESHEFNQRIIGGNPSLEVTFNGQTIN